MRTKDDASEGRTEKCTESADEVDEPVHARVVLHAVHLCDRRWQQRVVPAREHAVGDDEGDEACTGSGGPESEDGDGGEEALGTVGC